MRAQNVHKSAMQHISYRNGAGIERQEGVWFSFSVGNASFFNFLCLKKFVLLAQLVLCWFCFFFLLVLCHCCSCFLFIVLLYFIVTTLMFFCCSVLFIFNLLYASKFKYANFFCFLCYFLSFIFSVFDYFQGIILYGNYFKQGTS